MLSKKSKILFVLKFRETPGGDYSYSAGWGDGKGKFLHSGLYNSANMVHTMLKEQGYDTKLVHVIDNNAIHKEIVKFGATHVVIEAFWVVPSKFDELFRVCPNVKFIIRNHSESPFLANEGMAFEWTMKYVDKPNVIMSCNAPRMVEETRFLVQTKYPHWSRKEVEHKVPHLPNYYPVSKDHKNPGFWIRGDNTVHIGCFGAIRPLKAHITQAIGALKFAEDKGMKLKFHINGGRIEMNGAPILKNLRAIFDEYAGKHELVEHAWMAHDQFKALVGRMDLVTQVSFSETFNIVAADAITQGVPTITSKEISWSSCLFRADPTESNDIANKMGRAYWAHRNFTWFNPSRKGLIRYNANSVKKWTSYFD